MSSKRMDLKIASSYRLSPECRRLMERLSQVMGVSQASVLEYAVRKVARLELLDGERVGAMPRDGRYRKGR
jgi:hypothetical protein